MTMAMAVVTKYRTTVLTLRRPMVDRLSSELTPVTKETKTRGTISILISRIKRSPSGFKAVAYSGTPLRLNTTPTTKPAIRAINICFQRASRRHPLKGPLIGFVADIGLLLDDRLFSSQ